MKANENNFVDLIRKRREEGILYVIEAYGGLLHSIVQKRLFMAPDRIDECMNDIFLGIWRNIDSFDENRGNFVKVGSHRHPAKNTEGSPDADSFAGGCGNSAGG